MIWQAIRAKYAERGAYGFLVDSVELAVGCGVVGIYSGMLFSAAVAGVVVAAPIAAAQWVGELAEYKER